MMNLLESLFGSIADAIEEARRQQAAAAAAILQPVAAPQPIVEPVRRRQAPAAVKPARQPAHPPPSDPLPAASLELFEESRDLVRAVVMAEVLAKPVALREMSTFTHFGAL